MIVSHPLRFIYAGPPKTATTSLHEWLRQPRLQAEPWTPDQTSQHSFETAPAGPEYYRFATVRHPFDRTVSLWRHSQIGGIKDGGLSAMSFAEFIAWVPDAPRFYSAPQADYLADAQIDSLVYYEALEADLLRLPFLAGLLNLDPIPIRNPTRHDPWYTYYTPELDAAVREHFQVDFDLYY